MECGIKTSIREYGVGLLQVLKCWDVLGSKELFIDDERKVKIEKHVVIDRQTEKRDMSRGASWRVRRDANTPRQCPTAQTR